MNALDSTKTQFDTLRFTTDDQCPQSGIIPVQGHTQDVFALLKTNGKDRIDTMMFEDVCPGQLSNVQLFQYRSLVLDTVKIDTFIYDPNINFFGPSRGVRLLP